MIPADHTKDRDRFSIIRRKKAVKLQAEDNLAWRAPMSPSAWRRPGLTPGPVEQSDLNDDMFFGGVSP